MSPEEREAAENKVICEYREACACLSLLHGQLSDIMVALRHLDSGFRRRTHLEDEHIEALVPLGEVLADYRQTRARCVELHKTLSNVGFAEIITDVSFPDL